MTKMKNKYITQEDIRDCKVSWFVGAYFISSTANMTMKTVLPIPETIWGLVSLMWGVIILFFMLRGANVVLQRSKNLIFKSLSVFILVFFWSFILITARGEPTKVLTSSIAVPTLMFFLPVGIYACSVRRMEILYRVMLKTSYIITALLVVCFLFRNGASMDGEDANSYNMFFGYSMSFASLFQLNEFFRIKDKKLLLLVILQFLLIVLYANRGALLSLGFFVFYKLVLDQTSLMKKIFWISALAIVLVVLMFYAETIATSALQYLGGYNMESRTLQKMAADALDESDARDDLRAIAIKMIGDSPILGWGIGGECYTIGMKYSGTTELDYGFSPHNGVLQHWLYLGVFMGTIVNLLLILPIFKLRRIKDEYRHGLILVCCSAYFITTLWSSCDILLKPAVAIYIYLAFFYRNNIRIR